MGDPIAPDVDDQIIEMCDEQTLLNAHGDIPRIEVHAPFGTDREDHVSVKHGVPFIAVLEHDGDDSTIEAVGYFDYTGADDGLPSIPALIRQYGPFDEDERLSQDEREFLEYLIQNQYRPSGPLPMESWDWSEATYSGDYLVAEQDPDEFWHTGEMIYPNDDPMVDEDEKLDFDVDRRDELVAATMEMLRNVAVEVADVDPDGTYIVRHARLHDFRDRAQQLYVNAPPVTQAQAVSWALAELGLTQDQIATLCGKSQPTIHNHLERATTHYVNAEKTAEAFGDLPRYMQRGSIDDVRRDIETDIANERFRFEKSLVAIRAKCPECGLDAGEWEGGEYSGGWVDEPTRFWQGEKILDSYQAPRDPRYVECPDCGHMARRSRFESEWTDDHGPVKDDRPEPF